MAKVQIHESNLSKVKLGLGVRVTVDALPGREFTGHIAHIAQLPDAQSIFMNPDLKVYDSEIYLDGDGSDLRTGMSCRAEIMIEQYETAMYVPVQAVVFSNSRAMVQVVIGSRVENREVEVGLDNNRMIRIISNLKVGERVLLTPEAPEISIDDQSGLEDIFVAPSKEPIIVNKKDEAPPMSKGEGRGMDEMSKAQIDEMRKRYESMTPEEREKMKQSRGGGKLAGDAAQHAH
jgi:HlyD family secretion protein